METLKIGMVVEGNDNVKMVIEQVETEKCFCVWHNEKGDPQEKWFALSDLTESASTL